MNLRYFGFDVSFWQDDNNTPQGIDFNKMKAFGASFVIPKAGQWYYEDQDFRVNWENAAKAGIPRGSYWFCDVRDTGRNQARKYWDIIKSDIGEGPHFADFEGGSWTRWNELYNFMFEFQQLSGLPNEKIGVYTGYYYWTRYAPFLQSQRDWFKKYPLWLAWYSQNPYDVRLPNPWQELTIWQDGTPVIGEFVGVESKEVDHNWFNGDDTKLKLFFGEVIAPPPAGEDTMYNCKVFPTATPYVNIRDTPDGSDIGDMFPNEEFQADRIDRDAAGRPWLHSIKPGKVGYVAAWLCSYESVDVQDDYPVEITVKMASGKIFVSTEINEQ